MNKITISIIGLGIAALAIFIAVDFGSRERLKPAREPFLCEGQPCNVILIIPETSSARHMGIYGYERDTTPFIDEFFSEESLIFENAWSNAPWTVPSFAALFTSQLASDVFVEGRTDKLSDTIATFVDILDENEIPKFAAHTRTLLPLPNIDLNLITRVKPEERFQGEDPFLFLKAAEWIAKQTQKDDGQPFFLLLQPLTPHSPYDPPGPYRYFFDAPSEYPGPALATKREMFEIKQALQQGEDIEVKLKRFRLQYDQEIRYLDSQVESFISQIPEEVLRSTVFMLTSDHGEAFGQHKNIDHGLNLYEEEIHIPFLIRAPGIEQKRIQEPITHLDTGPTILEIFGLERPDTFRGTSLLPALRGEELRLEERIVRAERVDPIALPGAWETVETKVRTESLPNRERAARKQEWKLIQHADGSLELYDLEKDYWEQDNLIPQWHSLSSKEQAEILPLFEAVGESPTW